jgi:tetratricopeptide (TPR) repeat protein
MSRRGTRAALLAITLVASAAPASAARDPLERIAEDLRTGHYERARKAADALARRPGLGTRAAILGARAERSLGLLREARGRLEEASVRAPDDLPLRAELLRVVEALGDRGARKALVDRSYEDWQAGKVRRTHAPDLVAMAVALRLDNNFDDANASLRAAVRVDPKGTEANLEWADIFLEKHSAGNAEASFRDVLKVDPRNPDAHAGLARVMIEQSYDEAAAEVELAAALAVNPRHAGALALRAEIALDAEELDQVAALVAELRRTNPRDEAAAWLAAARALLLDDRAGYDREKEARLATRPADGAFFARVAEALVRHRRYEDARAVAADGVARDGQNAEGLASLGLTLLRLGDEQEGVAVLRRAWDRDPYDARTFNLLDLFEKVIPKRYTTVETEHLSFRVEPAARVAVETVVGPFLEEVYRGYAQRYGFTPTGRVVFELYGDPAHYGIRTVGLPRLGVTAVCFGRVITSQSPTNAAFNWGMVLAHELAHVFALQLSRSRVPRWFTEGLAELETARMRPEWRRHGELALWIALGAGALAPLEKLSQSFVRARDPEDASTAYLHAAMAVEHLEKRFGFPRIRQALVDFGRGERVRAVLEKMSGEPIEVVERTFRRELEASALPVLRDNFHPARGARYARPGPLEAPRGGGRAERPEALAREGLGLLQEGDPRAARARLARALLLPGGRADPWVTFLVAELALTAGDMGTAVTELESLVARNRDGYDVRIRLATAALKLGEEGQSEAHLRRAVELAPTEPEPRVLLMELYERLGRAEDRQREAEAIVRLEPQSAALAKRAVLEAAARGRQDTVAELAPIAIFIDPADADLHGALGRALAGLGRTREARQAFERALRFRPSDPAAHRGLAEVLDRLGERERAAGHRRAASAPADAGVSAASPPAPSGPARSPRRDPASAAPAPPR